VRYWQHQYTWEEAKDTCVRKGLSIARVPIPPLLMADLDFFSQSYIESDVWILDASTSTQCSSVKKQCKAGKLRTSALGTTYQCEEEEWVPVAKECSAQLRYVICSEGKLCSLILVKASSLSGLHI